MNWSLRKPIIAGNLKMNKTVCEMEEYINVLNPLVKSARCEVILCVPFIDLPIAVENTKMTSCLKIGAQNCHWEERGAFTGEISATMLNDMGVEYVIIGHSERRQYFGETDQTVNLRMRSGLKAGLKVILCVGENLEHRELGLTEPWLIMQLKSALHGVTSEELKHVIIAYEPIWAIGTGKTATVEQAEEACKTIRSLIKKEYDTASAEAIEILYGGSMNSKNAKELLNAPDIDGGLIGGASLDAKDFFQIVDATHR